MSEPVRMVHRPAQGSSPAREVPRPGVRLRLPQREGLMNMKVRVERSTLAEAATWVAKAIPRNASIPALSAVRLHAEAGVLTLSAFDYSVSHLAAMEATLGDEGDCLVSATFFRDAVNAGRGSEVGLVTTERGLEISSGRSTYRASLMPLGEAPTLPAFPEVHGVISAEALAEAVSLVAPAMDDDNPTPAIRGVHVEATLDRLTFVATDRYRIHVAAVPWKGDRAFKTTVSGGELQQAAKGMNGSVEVAYAENNLGLSDGRRRVSIRPAATAYIPWTQTVGSCAERCTQSVIVDRDDLLAAVKQVGAMAETDAPTLLDFIPGEVTVSTPSQELGEGFEVLPAEGEADLSLAVNHRYFADALSVTRGPVELRFGGSYVKSGAFIVADQSQPELTLIVMSKSLPGGTR